MSPDWQARAGAAFGKLNAALGEAGTVAGMPVTGLFREPWRQQKVLGIPVDDVLPTFEVRRVDMPGVVVNYGITVTVRGQDWLVVDFTDDDGVVVMKLRAA